MYRIILICLLFRSGFSTQLCQQGFCSSYVLDPGCTTTSSFCNINNATHTGLWLLSPTTCNCCDYCMPFYGENEACTVGGPGTGVAVGRCGDGLTCVAESSGNFCRRMQSDCHSVQDDYDERYQKGETGSLEQRPTCDGKAKYSAFECVPAHTCFCQSETGDRIFGEVLNIGTTTQNMHCGCSRLHEKIKSSLTSGVRYPIIGPRCTSDGNFNPVQCIDRVCYCVDIITGEVHGDDEVVLDKSPITELSCYDASLDLFPELWEGEAPYNYTTPCLENMKQKIEVLETSEQDGYIVDYFSTVPECMPDGTYGRIDYGVYGSKICVDEWGLQIDDYQAAPGTNEYDTINCKCAQTTSLMQTSMERPVCCKNGNYRPIQCRRGLCRCVDEDGRQMGKDSSDVTTLPCYTETWRTC